MDIVKPVIKDTNPVKEVEGFVGFLVPGKSSVDATTLTACIWLMYKLNMITRIQVRDFLDIIKKGDWPDNMIDYLQKEVSKLG